jgi:hypothetical protein
MVTTFQTLLTKHQTISFSMNRNDKLPSAPMNSSDPVVGVDKSKTICQKFQANNSTKIVVLHIFWKTQS